MAAMPGTAAAASMMARVRTHVAECGHGRVDGTFTPVLLINAIMVSIRSNDPYTQYTNGNLSGRWPRLNF
jgi:hypothetical protein